MPHTNFPFLVKIAGQDYLKARSAGGEIEGASPLDLRFATAGDQRLDHEIAAADYDGTAGDALSWVRIPHLATGADTAIYQYTGKAGLAATEQSAAGLWRDYLGVWDTRDGRDRSGNGHDLTVLSAPSSGTLIGRAGQYNNSLMSGDALFLNGLESVTISFWCKPDSLPTEGNIWAIGPAGNTAGANRHYFRFNSSGSGSGATDVLKYGLNSFHYWSEGGALTSSATFVCITWRVGEVPKLYVNGEFVSWVHYWKQDTSGVVSDPFAVAPGEELLFGPTEITSVDAPLHGLFDEFRITPLVRSPGWIKTEYVNQAFPASFFSVGADAEPVPADAYDGLSGEDNVVVPPPPPPPTSMNTTDEWFADEAIPTAPTVPEPEVKKVSTRGALDSAITTALNSGNAGNLTVIRLTADITLTSNWVTTYSFSGHGGRLVIDFNGRQIDCGSHEFGWTITDNMDFNAVTNRVTAMSHTAGEAPDGKTTVTFATLPANLSIGDWIKLGTFSKIWANAEAYLGKETEFKEAGQALFTRWPHRHTLGEAMQVESISSNTVTFTTKLYHAKYWDQVTEPIYGGRYKNKPESFWLVDFKAIRNSRQYFNFGALVDARVIRPYMGWDANVNIGDGRLCTARGAVQFKMFDWFMGTPSGLSIAGNVSYGFNPASCKRLHLIRTPACPFTENARGLKSMLDGGEAWTTIGTDTEKLLKAGGQIEPGISNGKMGDAAGQNPVSSHSQQVGQRVRGDIQTIGTNNNIIPRRIQAWRGTHMVVEGIDMVANPPAAGYFDHIFQPYNESSAKYFEFGAVGSNSGGYHNACFGHTLRDSVLVDKNNGFDVVFLGIFPGYYGPMYFDNNTWNKYGSNTAFTITPGVANGYHSGEREGGGLGTWRFRGKEGGGLVIQSGSTCRKAFTIGNGAIVEFDHFRIDVSAYSSGSFTIMSLEGAETEEPNTHPACSAFGTINVYNPNNIDITDKTGGGSWTGTIINE